MFWGGGNFSCRHPKLWSYIKSNVKAFFITGAIVFTISASATTVKMLHSRQVRYKNDKSVEQAINELYRKGIESGKIIEGCLGCTKLEYLESTGTQYIDTGYVFKDKPKIVGEIRLNSSTDLDIMGTATAKQGNFIIDFWGGTLFYRYSSPTYTQFNTVISVGDWYNFEFSDKVIVDGVEKGSISTYDFSSNDQNFLIGRGRNYGFASFKEIKMYDGNTLVRDLIPVYSESLNKNGFFDIIGKHLYTSETSSDFIAPIKKPTKDTELRYIQSTGSQYIDTGYVFKDKPKIVGEIRLDSSSDLDIMGTATAKQGGFIIDFASSILYYRYSSPSFTRFDTGISVGNWYNFEFSDKVIVDGVEKGSISTYDFSNNDQSFLIGRGRNFGIASFKEIKMYDGNTLVRDLIPYYKKSVDKIGMLDKVNDVFYENKGSGEFLYG